MAGNDKLIALVNSFASAVLSVGREVGLNITLNKWDKGRQYLHNSINRSRRSRFAGYG